ncbi:hypothetical protein ACFL5V_01440 [Fibrobacterota bacterium]
MKQRKKTCVGLISGLLYLGLLSGCDCPFFCSDDNGGSKEKYKLAATGEEVRQFLGVSAAKLVFEEGGSLFFVDFSSDAPEIQKINNADGAVVPCISPDGNWVTYAKGVTSEGEGGNGSVWICELSPDAVPIQVAAPGFEPRFVQDAAELTVIYVTEGGSNLQYGIGKTVKRTVTNGVPGPEVDVFTGGGYVGGLSWDNQYLSTGFQEGWMANVTTSVPVQVHELSFQAQDTAFSDSMISIQVCNSSISSSRIYTNTMMYIDFGFKNSSYSHGTLSGGQNWDIHEFIFISDYDKKGYKFLKPPPLPTGTNPGDVITYLWDDPEWSNHPYFAVTNLTLDRIFQEGGSWEHNIRNEQMYLMDLKNSGQTDVAALKVVEITETPSLSARTNLQWPWLWVEVPAGFVEEPGWMGAPFDL